MLNLKKYKSIMDMNYFYCYTWSITGLCLLLIILSCQGCSSKTGQDSLFRVQMESIGAPKFVVQYSSYDFGTIRPNSTNKAIFNFANAGDKTLVIKEVKKCCGAVIELDKQKLAPGERGVLTAEYRAGTGAGTFRREIGLVTNEPDNSETTLIITGEMKQTLQWEPKSFTVASFEKDFNCPEIKIKSLDKTVFSVKNFASSVSCLSVEFYPNYSSEEIILKPKLIAEKLKELNTNSGSVLIELNHPDYKQISLKFDVIPSLQTIPAQVLVFNADVNKPITKSIVLQDNETPKDSNVSSQIESVASENGTKVEMISSAMEDKNCKLNLKITPIKNKDSESILKDQIVIKLKDGRSLNIPMRIFYSTQTLTSKAG